MPILLERNHSIYSYHISDYSIVSTLIHTKLVSLRKTQGLKTVLGYDQVMSHFLNDQWSCVHMTIGHKSLGHNFSHMTGHKF